jgi:hypothetical protein
MSERIHLCHLYHALYHGSCPGGLYVLGPPVVTIVRMLKNWGKNRKKQKKKKEAGYTFNGRPRKTLSLRTKA